MGFTKQIKNKLTKTSKKFAYYKITCNFTTSKRNNMTRLIILQNRYERLMELNQKHNYYHSDKREKYLRVLKALKIQLILEQRAFHESLLERKTKFEINRQMIYNINNPL